MATSVTTGYGAVTDEGEILVGARVFICNVGTTTLKSIYSDAALSSGLTNPMQTDADGFHAQAYLSGSYKVRIEKNGTDTLGSGTLVRQWDNIDGGVPVGSGDLPVADGGTGASTAAAARTNLSVPSQSELDDLSTQLAALAGTVGSTGATQLATGTTAQRPADLSEGQIRRNTDTDLFEGYNGSTWENLFTTTLTATQAEIEANSFVPPGRVKFDPGVAKAHASFGVTGAISLGHNVSSITDTGTGVWTANWTTAFSSATYTVQHSLEGTNGMRILFSLTAASRTASATTLQTCQFTDGGANETGVSLIHVTAHGDQ
jgi:hypothetical protein